jgi:membrane associated rhomboid family serine protease
MREKVSLVDYLTTGHSPVLKELAISPLHMARGEWWTLLTCAFVHAGGLHLMLNLLSHGALGPSLEGIFGGVRFLAIWIISAIGGSVVVAALGQAAVGSSGAICGMIGAQAAFVAIYHAHIGQLATAQFRNWLIKTVIIIALLSSLPRVSAAAHLGGAVAGALVGALLAVNRFGPSSLRPFTILGAVAIPLLSIAYLNERGILRLAITSPELAQREIADFTIRLRPQIQRIEAFADEVEETMIEPLRGRRPEQRAPEDVRVAVVAMSKLRAEQIGLLEALVHTGKYQSPAVENARHAAEDLIKWRAQVSNQYEECLRRGDRWTLEKDENFLQFLLNQSVEAQIVYHRAAGGI